MTIVLDSSTLAARNGLQPMLSGEKLAFKARRGFHRIGERPFECRVQKGQIEVTSRIVWAFEKFGRATHVRWPRAERLARELESARTTRGVPTADYAPSNRK